MLNQDIVTRSTSSTESRGRGQPGGDKQKGRVRNIELRLNLPEGHADYISPDPEYRVAEKRFRAAGQLAGYVPYLDRTTGFYKLRTPAEQAGTAKWQVQAKLEQERVSDSLAPDPPPAPTEITSDSEAAYVAAVDEWCEAQTAQYEADLAAATAASIETQQVNLSEPTQDSSASSSTTAWLGASRTSAEEWIGGLDSSQSSGSTNAFVPASLGTSTSNKVKGREAKQQDWAQRTSRDGPIPRTVPESKFFRGPLTLSVADAKKRQKSLVLRGNKIPKPDTYSGYLPNVSRGEPSDPSVLGSDAASAFDTLPFGRPGAHGPSSVASASGGPKVPSAFGPIQRPQPLVATPKYKAEPTPELVSPPLPEPKPTDNRVPVTPPLASGASTPSPVLPADPRGGVLLGTQPRLPLTPLAGEALSGRVPASPPSIPEEEPERQPLTFAKAAQAREELGYATAKSAQPTTYPPAGFSGFGVPVPNNPSSSSSGEASAGACAPETNNPTSSSSEQTSAGACAPVTSSAAGVAAGGEPTQASEPALLTTAEHIAQSNPHVFETSDCRPQVTHVLDNAQDTSQKSRVIQTPAPLKFFGIQIPPTFRGVSVKFDKSLIQEIRSISLDLPFCFTHGDHEYTFLPGSLENLQRLINRSSVGEHGSLPVWLNHCAPRSDLSSDPTTRHTNIEIRRKAAWRTRALADHCGLIRTTSHNLAHEVEPLGFLPNNWPEVGSLYIAFPNRKLYSQNHLQEPLQWLNGKLNVQRSVGSRVAFESDREVASEYVRHGILVYFLHKRGSSYDFAIEEFTRAGVEHPNFANLQSAIDHFAADFHSGFIKVKLDLLPKFHELVG